MEAPRRGFLCQPQVMDQRVSLVTLGVADVSRALRFYEALGWSRESPDGDGVFFQPADMIVALRGRDQLAEDSAMDDRGGWDVVYPRVRQKRTDGETRCTRHSLR